LIFYRVFDWDRVSKGAKPGGPCYVPRARQGSGRHDIPERDGVLYVALNAVSAVAEAIQAYRNQMVDNEDFEIEGHKIQALSSMESIRKLRLIDLTDPRELARRSIRPAQVATRDRSVTQQLALSLFEERVDGFLWWSTLEAAWTNATLFQGRVMKKLRLSHAVKPLSIDLPEVVAAARHLNIRLTSRGLPPKRQTAR
jgi:hypothetical protein